jgi:hypothetical protein
VGRQARQGGLTCSSANSALWTLERGFGTNPDSKRLRNVNSDRCLNIAGGLEGSTLIQYTCGNFFNENFYFGPPTL